MLYGESYNPDEEDPLDPNKVQTTSFGITDPEQGPNKGLPTGAKKGDPYVYDPNKIASGGAIDYGTEAGTPTGLGAPENDPTANPGGWSGPQTPTTPGTPTGAAGAGPQGGNYQQWFQTLMGGQNTQEALLSHRAELEAAGFHISPPNKTDGSISKIQTPDGRWIRVIGQGEGHPVWIDEGDGSGSGGLGGAADGLFNMLLSRANQSTTADPNSPEIRSQYDAFDASQQRGRRNYLQELAEKMGAGANINAETRSSAEQVGQASSGYLGTLMAQQVAAKRAEIQAALSGAMGFLTSQQQLQLQERLKMLDAMEQRREWDQGLVQRSYEFDTNQDYLNSPVAHQ